MVQNVFNLVHTWKAPEIIRFQKDGIIATIKAHDLWNDVDVTQGTDLVCTSCKIMSIPWRSRGKKREPQVHNPLEEIQVDTVPSPESIGISTDSRFNYYLILCDRYSRIFRSIGLKDKSSEARIDGIEQIFLIFHNWKTNYLRTLCISEVILALNLDLILLENGVVRILLDLP